MVKCAQGSIVRRRCPLLAPIEKMLRQAENERAESDAAYFDALMYAGEAVMKLAVAGLTAAVQDDRERNRYRLEYELVRADSLGAWDKILDDILVGPSSQFLDADARPTQQALNQWMSEGTWQAASLQDLRESLQYVQLVSAEPTTTKIQGRTWFKEFVRLRNGTRGHGAPLATALGQACPSLARSIAMMASNLPLFSLPWAYLHRNLSGKYRVTGWGVSSETLENLKRNAGYSFANGVHIELGQFRYVALLDSDPEGSDYWFANGGFRDSVYEMLSYLTNDRIFKPSTPYMSPAGELPASETEGLGELDAKGSTFTNLPEPVSSYVPRPLLEKELEEQLRDTTRHFVVTLTGSGGIGKTSTALQVITRLINSGDCPYHVVVWFSARDVDLLQSGPKIVQPHGVSIADFAAEYSRLLAPGEMNVRAFRPEDYLGRQLAGDTIGPTLYVFDNFETTTSPVEVFKWLDTYVRGPNKVLITSRDRRFTGDYVVPVSGMTPPEAEELIGQTVASLGIKGAITDTYIEELINESNGHPYIIKIMLGEVASGARMAHPERIMAGHDEALVALFERSYNRLSPAAQRVFLTLCNWRSSVPALAIEAVLLRPENSERINVQSAIEELVQSSFVEETIDDSTGEAEISVPLAARLFGIPKLKVSVWRVSIQADTSFLHLLGARTSGPTIELGTRIERLFNNIAEAIAKEKRDLAEVRPVLDYITSRFSYGSVLLANLIAELGLNDSEVERCLLSYVEGNEHSKMPAWQAWRRIASIRRNRDDVSGELHALAQICRDHDTPSSELSNTANRINGILRLMPRGELSQEEKQVLIQDVVGVLKQSSKDFDATDLSRLAWLQLHLGEAAAARDTVTQGLAIDPDNAHCQRLEARLSGRS